MVTLTEGAEVAVEDTAEWSALSVEVGEVVEVFIGGTSYLAVADCWAAFLVVKVVTESDGSFLLDTRYLGCEDESLGGDLSRDFGETVVQLHLCLSKPCYETRETDAIHVTRVRIWKWPTFKGTHYLTKTAEAEVKKWLKEAKKEEDKLRGTPKRTPRRPAMKKPVPDKADAGGGVPGKDTITPEMKDALRSKLKEVKKKVLPKGKPGEVVEVDTEGEPKDGDESESESCSCVRTPDEETRLVTGTAIQDGAPWLATAAAGKTKKSKEPEAIKDISTKSLSGQLILRAVSVTKDRRKVVQKKEKKKGGSKEKLAHVLSQILTSGKKHGKEKKKKDKKKKRKEVDQWSDSELKLQLQNLLGLGGRAGGGRFGDGSRSTDEKEEQRQAGIGISSINRARREQMDQSSLADVPSGSHVLTGGVKIASYFALHVRGQFPQSQRELREMHSLAATMDLLRKGDVARVGDSLAARFMALHQALLDQGWSTAKHMELHSMDEANAASAALVLASRKHSRLVEKVQGKGQGGWQQRAKFKAKDGTNRVCPSVVLDQWRKSFTTAEEFTFSANDVQLRRVARGLLQTAGLSIMRGGTG